MSGRRRQGLAPTLFPFLAVLVCTLGTLILLLAMVAQNAGDAVAAADTVPPAEAESTAEQIAQAEALAQASEQIEREIREASWHRQQTVKLRDEQTADLEARRNRRAHLEDHARRLQLELKSLSTEVEAAIDQKGDVVKVQETLDKLLLEIESEKEAIGNLQSDLQSETPRIVIVPHKGPNGTDRRPVYIECGKDGVLIQPGNIRITQAELEPRTGFPNPLEAALRTIRLHATQTYGDAIAPYPLLVVRPDGIKSYGIARAAMTNWDDQFGYELVPTEVELAFPETDPVLSNKVTAVVRETVRQRDQLAIRFGGGGGGSGGGNGSRPGGYAGEYGEDGEYDGQSGLARPGGNGTRPGMADPGSADLATGGAAGGTSPSPSGTASPAASTLPVLSTARMSRGSTSGAIGESQLRGFSSLSNDSPPAGNAPRSNTAPGTAAGGPVYDNAYGSGLAEAGSGTNAQAGMQPNAPASSNGAAPTSLNAADGSVLADTKAAGQFADGTSTSSSDSSNSSPSNSSANSSSGGSSTSRSTSNTAGGTGGSQSNGQAAPSTQGQPGQTGNSENQPTDGPQTPSLNMTASNTPPVKRVGKDWALPPDISSSRGTEMLRMIRVECYSDRFVLIAEGGRGVPTVIPFADGDINAASLTLATAVRDRAAGWGAAMQGARWQPVLEVAVAPGADFRYQQLSRLLDGSGLLIQAKGAR